MGPVRPVIRYPGGLDNLSRSARCFVLPSEWKCTPPPPPVNMEESRFSAVSTTLLFRGVSAGVGAVVASWSAAVELADWLSYPTLGRFAPRLVVRWLPLGQGVVCTFARALVAAFQVPYGDWELGAPRSVRHPRDFRGPSVYRALQTRWWVAACLLWLATCCVVAVLWRSFTVFVNTPTGESNRLWEDLPRDLPGSLELVGRLTRNPVYGEVWPRGRVVPVTSAVAMQRLRRRARWVRAMEAVLGGRDSVVGQFVRGRWVPDLPTADKPPSVNYVLASIPSGARCLGGGITTGKASGDEPAPRHLFLVLDVGGECQVVYPDLLGKLRLYSMFRHRDELLLGALRTRAVEWCKGEGISPWESDLAVAGAVAIAMIPSTQETAAQSLVTRAIGTPPPPHTLA